MDRKELSAKLQTAKNIEDVKAILAEAGEEYTPEEAERIWQEIEHHRPSGKRKLDEDEMDAVSGGAKRDWIKEGCAATVQPFGEENCWTNDECVWFWETYSNAWATCPDGKPHEFDKKGAYEVKTCIRCRYAIGKRPGHHDGLFRPSN